MRQFKVSQHTDVNNEFNVRTDEQVEGEYSGTRVCFGAEVTIGEYRGLQFNRLFPLGWYGTR